MKYEEGQKYGVHHDFTHHTDRLLAVFLSLNDVQEGGETNFLERQVSVPPKCGRSVVRPSVHQMKSYCEKRSYLVRTTR